MWFFFCKSGQNQFEKAHKTLQIGRDNASRIHLALQEPLSNPEAASTSGQRTKYSFISSLPETSFILPFVHTGGHSEINSTSVFSGSHLLSHPQTAVVRSHWEFCVIQARLYMQQKKYPLAMEMYMQSLVWFLHTRPSSINSTKQDEPGLLCKTSSAEKVGVCTDGLCSIYCTHASIRSVETLSQLSWKSLIDTRSLTIPPILPLRAETVFCLLMNIFHSPLLNHGLVQEAETLEDINQRKQQDKSQMRVHSETLQLSGCVSYHPQHVFLEFCTIVIAQGSVSERDVIHRLILDVLDPAISSLVMCDLEQKEIDIFPTSTVAVDNYSGKVNAILHSNPFFLSLVILLGYTIAGQAKAHIQARCMCWKMAYTVLDIHRTKKITRSQTYDETPPQKHPKLYSSSASVVSETHEDVTTLSQNTKQLRCEKNDWPHRPVSLLCREITFSWAHDLLLMERNHITNTNAAQDETRPKGSIGSVYRHIDGEKCQSAISAILLLQREIIEDNSPGQHCVRLQTLLGLAQLKGVSQSC